MFGITDFYGYLLGVIVIILLPGPNSLYCLSVATQHGIKSGYQVVLGILLGDGILMFLAVVGVGALLKLYPALFVALKIFGGSYLAYLGLKMLVGAYKSAKNDHKNITDNAIDKVENGQNNHDKMVKNHKKLPYFYRSLTLSLTNPKAIFFFLSFFIGFVDPNYAYPALSFTILGTVLQIVSFAYLSFLVLFGAELVQKLSGRKWLESGALAAVGILFVGFAVNLWRTSI